MRKLERVQFPGMSNRIAENPLKHCSKSIVDFGCFVAVSSSILFLFLFCSCDSFCRMSTRKRLRVVVGSSILVFISVDDFAYRRLSFYIPLLLSTVLRNTPCSLTSLIDRH